MRRFPRSDVRCSRSELVGRLRRFDTLTISDACERSGSEHHVVTGIAPLTAPVRVAGAVITVQLGPADDSSGRSGRHLATAAVDTATSDRVIVIDHQGRSDCAGWGGNVSRGAKQRGCGGTIIDGADRDIDEAAAIGYPVFGSGSTPRTARGGAVEVGCQTPIASAGVPAMPGDLAIAGDDEPPAADAAPGTTGVDIRPFDHHRRGHNSSR